MSLEYVEVDTNVDQLSHQYLYQVKLKGEIDLVWLNANNFIEAVKYNKRRSQDSLPRKPQFAQKPEKEIKRKRKVEGGQSTIPRKIRKKSVDVIQSYSFGLEASLLGEECGIYKELGLKQQDVTDIFKIVSAISYQIFIFSPNDRLSKTMKNVFYFIKKALFVLEIFKSLCFFLSFPLFLDSKGQVEVEYL